MIGLGAIGVTLTYSILRFANFAHGEFIAWGAYGAGARSALLGFVVGRASRRWAVLLRLAAAARGAMVAMALTGAPGDRARRAPVRPAAAARHRIIMVIACFGVAMALRSLLEFSSPRSRLLQQRAADRHSARRRRSRHAGSAAVARAGHGPGRRYAPVPDPHRSAASMRAVAENPALAGVVGVDVRR